ncbi:hypothetical protein BU17DRAFT_60107 [Hysterangium stoloniferum]|nr:hypothetical protein BU17DRAFT_60107 [Hysterangium stoloniferum]
MSEPLSPAVSFLPMSALTIHHEKSMWQRWWSLGKVLYLFIDPGLATFCSGEAQAEAIYVIIHFRVLVLVNKTIHSMHGTPVKSSCGYFIWWDIFSLVFID